MSENASVSDELDDEEESSGESQVIRDLRKQLRLVEKQRKAEAEELTRYREAHSQERQNRLNAVVDGRELPSFVVEALKTKAEEASDEEFDAILQELGPVPQEQVEARQAPVVGNLGQQVATAASKGGAPDPTQRIAGAKTREELAAVIAELRLDQV